MGGRSRTDNLDMRYASVDEPESVLSSGGVHHTTCNSAILWRLGSLATGVCPWRARRPFILSRPRFPVDVLRGPTTLRGQEKCTVEANLTPMDTRVGCHGAVCHLLTFINLRTENSRKFGGVDAPSGNLAWPATGTSIQVETWLIRQCDLATKTRQRPTSP